MMSNEEPTAAAVASTPRTPSDAVYTDDVAHPLTARRVPYHTPAWTGNVNLVRSKGNMGVVLAPSDNLEWTDVFGNEQGSVLLFNEPNNRMGLKLASMIIDVMGEYKSTGSSAKKRKAAPGTPSTSSHDPPATPNTQTGGKVSEAGPCAEVYKAVVTKLANLLEVDNDDITERQQNYAFYVMKHFALPRDGNHALDQVLLIFARIRLGQYTSEWYEPESFRRLDEFKAAIFAIQMALMEFLKSRGEKPRETGKPSWTLPIVHMLNDHMTLRNVEPLVFHETGTTEDLLAPIRASHCNTIFSQQHQIYVENRPIVVHQLKKFARDVMNVNLTDPPLDEGAPTAGATGTPTRRRSRRSLF